MANEDSGSDPRIDKIILTAIHELKTELHARLAGLDRKLDVEIKSIKREMAKLSDKLSTVEVDLSIVRQRERRLAGVGRYAVPIHPEVEPQGNGHGTYIWETKLAGPRYG
jgi:hypothetical protein